MPNARVLLSLIAAIAMSGCDMPPERPEDSEASGAKLYRIHCASCHGEHADGKGPVAPFIAAPVPDLTRIAERRGGEFPEIEVFRIIDGQAALAAHGGRHMPVWGYEFFGEQSDDRLAHQQATQRVERVVDYLRTIQRQ